jgi:hypothetical protein
MSLAQIPIAKLVALFVIALAFRLALLAVPADRAAGDQGQYLELAGNLRTHAVLGDGDIPAAHRPPLYPLILEVLGPTGTQVLQLIAGAAIAPLTFAIASPLVPPLAAMIAGLAMALAPMSGLFCTLFMTETLFTFLLVLGAFFWMIRRPVLCGICFGLAALLRAVLLPFLIFLPLLAFRRVWRSTLIIALTAFAVIAPWTLRNAVELHRFIPIATAGWGSNLFQGTLDVPSGNPWPFIMQERRDDGEAALLKRGLHRIWDSPGRWLIVRAKQYPKLYLDDEYYFLGRWEKPVMWGIWSGNIAVLVLALVGWWRMRPGPHVWLYPAFTAVSQLPMWTEARYSSPMIPFLLILAAGSFAALRGGKSDGQSIQAVSSSKRYS